MAMATTAFTIGAPAKMIDMTTVGDPRTPNASNTQNAPVAPTTPASKDHPMPLTVQVHAAPWYQRIIKGAITAVRK